jgi:lysophospholipase L1-like esterase
MRGALLAALLLLAVPAAASAKEVLVVGDSLEVGTGPYLPRALPHDSVTVDAKKSRPSNVGVGVLRSRLKAGQAVVVFDLGTNDDPSQSGVLLSQLEQVRRIIGDRCLVVATINRPPYQGTSYAAMNRTIEDFAARDGNTQVVPWLLATRLHPEVVYPDGVHVTPYGYEFRAHLIATAVSQCPGGPPPVNQFQAPSGATLPPATAGTQPPAGAAAAPAPPSAPFHPVAVIRGAGAAVAGLVIGAIERLVAAAEQIP